MDLENNLISYGEKKIMIIIDDNNEPWFSANDISNILKYKDITRSVQKIVEKSDKKKYKYLQKYVVDKNINVPQNKIFLSESGLYSLMLSSKMKEAKKFKKWLRSELLPKLNLNGYYKINEKIKNEMFFLTNQIKKLRKEKKILLHNQKKKSYTNGVGTVYVMQPINSLAKDPKKIGKSSKFKSRVATYNTSVPDDMKKKYSIEVENPEVVEKCIKAVLTPFVYRDNKEYYTCTLKKMIRIFKSCARLIKKESAVASRVSSGSGIFTKIADDIPLDEKVIFYIDIDQVGGGYGADDLHDIYLVCLIDYLIYGSHKKYNFLKYLLGKDTC